MNKPIQTIRYMGNKAKLLDFIIPEIKKIVPKNSVICDIMAGTNTVGYALADEYKIISNDIQYYSYVIARALFDLDILPTKEFSFNEINEAYMKNLETKEYSFFYDNYSDTYFSPEQCLDIDSIRYAIDNLVDKKYYYFYLTLLMGAMCKAESTTGHFAQYLDKSNKRCEFLRSQSVYDLFYEKIDDFSEWNSSSLKHEHFNLDYNILFNNEIMKNVDCFYLDSPYTNDQYSRFYHVLETICKYDYPKLFHKAKYREERVSSQFCYSGKVLNEFEKIISFSSNNNSSLVISYSNKGVAKINDVLELCKKYYKNVILKEYDFNHSSQGNGSIKIKEILIICKI